MAFNSEYTGVAGVGVIANRQDERHQWMENY